MIFIPLSTPLTIFDSAHIAFAEEDDENVALIDKDYIEEANDKANFGEKFVVSIVMAPVNFIIDLFGARDISFLVFQRPEMAPKFGSFSDDDAVYLEIEDTEETSDGVTDVRDNLVLGVFTDDYFKGVALIYDMIHSLLPIPLAMMLAFGGLVLLFDVLNSDARSKFKEYILGALFVVLLFRFGHLLWEFIFRINYFIVDLVWVTLNENDIYTGRFLNVIFGTSVELSDIQSLGTALLALVAFFMTFILNFQYTMRMITLSVLIFTFPLVSLSLIFPSRREAMNIWIHEFTSNVFIQAAHALALGLFFYLRHMLGGDISFWVLCVFLFGMPSIVFMVQKLVGAFTGVQGSGGALSNFGKALGMASLVNMLRMVQTRQKSSSSPVGVGEQGAGTGGGTGGNDVSRAGTSALNSGNSNLRNRELSKGSTVPMSDGSNRQGNVLGRNDSRGMRQIGLAVQRALESDRGRMFVQGAKDMARVGAKAGLVATGGAMGGMATGRVSTGMAAGHVAANLIDGQGQNKEQNNDGLNGIGIHGENQEVEETNNLSVPSDLSYVNPYSNQETDEGIVVESSKLSDSHGVADPSNLPRSFQTFASQPEALRNFHGKNAFQNRETSVPHPDRLSYPTDPQSRERALQRANEGYKNAREHLRQMDRRITPPDVYRNAQISALQARNNRNLARNLADPSKHMNTPAAAARQASLATRNYQEAQLALSQNKPNTDSYRNQEAVVRNAKDIMNQSVGYANQTFPQLQNPELQESIVNYNQALNNNDVETAKSIAEKINNAPVSGGISVSEGHGISTQSLTQQQTPSQNLVQPTIRQTTMSGDDIPQTTNVSKGHGVSTQSVTQQTPSQRGVEQPTIQQSTLSSNVPQSTNIGNHSVTQSSPSGQSIVQGQQQRVVQEDSNLQRQPMRTNNQPKNQHALNNNSHREQMKKLRTVRRGRGRL